MYVFDRTDGTFTNRTYGGKGDMTQHGKFSTNHGCTFDPRNGMIAVSDTLKPEAVQARQHEVKMPLSWRRRSSPP